MPSSNHNIRSLTIIFRDLYLFYDTLVACGCSQHQGLKENPRHSSLTHYTNDQLPNVDGLIPPIVVKKPIDDIEKTRRNTSLCSFLEKLEAKTTMFHPTLTNSFTFV